MRNKKEIRNNSIGFQADRDITINNFIIPPFLKENGYGESLIDANHIYLKRYEDFLNEFSNYLEKKGLGDYVCSFSEPNNQFALYEAANIVARNDIPEKRLLLSNLLADKIRRNNEDDSADKYAQAIKAIGNINLSNIHLLALIEITTSVMAFHFNGTSLSYLKVLIDYMDNTEYVSFKALEYCKNLGLVYMDPFNSHIRDAFNDENLTIEERIFFNKVDFVVKKYPDLNSCTLSPTGEAIASAFLKDSLGLEYITGYRLPREVCAVLIERKKIEQPNEQDI